MIDLLFADESGFSLEPSIPYGWLLIDKQTSTRSEHKFIGNVFGLLKLYGHGQMHWTHKRINSEFVAKSLDQFCEQIRKPTVVVLDNAPWHRSSLIQQKISEWRTKNLYVFYLPPYSPQLNMIEILWRKIKYEWLEPRNYTSASILKSAVLDIFDNLGGKFKINFSDDFLLTV